MYAHLGGYQPQNNFKQNKRQKKKQKQRGQNENAVYAFIMAKS